jgi:hypothetical protein
MPLRRAGLAPEVIADPEERLSVRSQVALTLHGTPRDIKLNLHVCSITTFRPLAFKISL